MNPRVIEFRKIENLGPKSTRQHHRAMVVLVGHRREKARCIWIEGHAFIRILCWTEEALDTVEDEKARPVSIAQALLKSVDARAFAAFSAEVNQSSIESGQRIVCIVRTPEEEPSKAGLSGLDQFQELLSMPRFSSASWSNECDQVCTCFCFLAQTFKQVAHSLTSKVRHAGGNHRIMVVRRRRFLSNLNPADFWFLQPPQAPFGPTVLNSAQGFDQSQAAILIGVTCIRNHVNAVSFVNKPMIVVVFSFDELGHQGKQWSGEFAFGLD